MALTKVSGGGLKDLNLGSENLITTGNVGIGTTSPSNTLDIGSGNIEIGGGNNTALTWSSDVSSHYLKFTTALNGLTLNGYGGLAFETNGANERMRIDSSGRVGIGTSSPDGRITVQRASNNQGISGGIAFKGQDGTTQGGVGTDGVNTNNLQILAAEGIYFHTGNTDGTTNIRATLDSSGRLGVGTISPAQALHVVGEIVATDDITAFYSSDRRLKKDIEPIPNAVEKVKQINGVSYSWNDEYLKNKEVDGYFVREREVGVIAQEIEEVLPELVATRENGYKAVKYDRLVALLIEAVKEQQQQIDELKAKLEG